MTLGVRGIVINPRDEVLLVRHTYVNGWHLPGGGVERGESLQTSLARELAEEGNIVLDEEPKLHGIFFNRENSQRDHVAVYFVRRFRQSGPRPPDREIAEARFFARDALPEGIDRASRERIEEVLNGAPLRRVW